MLAQSLVFLTFVDVGFTVDSCICRCAVAGVVVSVVGTSTPMLTRVSAVALVHNLTVFTCMLRRTLTGIAVDTVTTCASVLTGT